MTDTTNEMLRLSIELWHPECWTIRVTERTNARLRGHGAHTTAEGVVNGRFTVYGDDADAVNALIAETRESRLTQSVQEIQHTFRSQSDSITPPGNVTQEIFVEYDAANSIDEAFISRGFIYDGPTNIRDGSEEWSLVAHHDRETVQDLFAEIRRDYDAEIEVTRITPTSRAHAEDAPLMRQLSERQREIFEFARKNDYYQWPREATARELAAEVDISKTTFLEHLRKAEAKILNDIE